MSKKDERYESLKLCNQVCFPLYACSKELVRQYTPLLKKLDLTYTQYLVMMVLWEKEEVSSRELAECLHLDYGTLTPVLKRLEKSELLVRQRMEEDERLLAIRITKQGKELQKKAIDIPTSMASRVGLTKKEFETLYQLTYKALSNMENKNTRGE